MLDFTPDMISIENLPDQYWNSSYMIISDKKIQQPSLALKIQNEKCFTDKFPKQKNKAWNVM